MQDAGRPIRSSDLREKAAENDERFRSAERSVRRARRQSEMAKLALRAQPRPKPPETRPGSAYVVYARPLPGDGGERFGQFVTGQALSRAQKIRQAEAGSGALELLRAEAIWADTSSDRTKSFEAQLDPARLVEYNEIHVPHIAGTVGIELFGDQGSFRVGNLQSSRLVRLEQPRRFNGRIRLTSTSEVTAPDGDYIHAVGGIGLYQTDWARTQDVSADLQVPDGGTLQSVSARLRPSGRSPEVSLSRGGSALELPASVSSGEVIRVSATGVDGVNATSLVELELEIA